MKTVPV